MSRSNHSQGTFRGSWRAAGPLSVAFVLGATLGLSQMTGASASTAGGHEASGSGGHPGLIYTNRVVGFPQHFSTSPTALQAARSHSRPTITSQPVSVTVTAGSPASFSAAASGSPTPTVQWQFSTNSGGSWSNVSGANSTTYSLSTTTTSENGWEYRAVFTNLYGSARTSAATLTVTSPVTVPPTITSQPVSVTVAAGSPASFSAAASGSPTPTVQWQFSTDGGKSWSNVTGATSTTYSFTTATTENGYEYEAVFTNSSGSATTNAATLTVTAAPEQSSNWSGYADTGSGFSAVSGSWVVPTVSCSSGNSYSAHWIGIDGATSSTVEQDGTEADCSGGSGSYDAWYEMYGDSAVNSGYEVELSPSSYTVFPGDAISASVSVVSGSWTLAISDSGSASHPHSWNFSTNIAFSGAAQSSAEWIVERPDICNIFFCSLATLANFGTVTFTNASATENGTPGSISTWSNAAIEMVNGSTPIAVPGSLDPTGKIFTDTYE
jgi:peptidase A4-like protein/Ig-like domain-containing protein